jgi:predicted unusual protein kinase regulating ubiquinone biosynthesis (AarF/ABC1/UbiB family)
MDDMASSIIPVTQSNSTMLRSQSTHRQYSSTRVLTLQYLPGVKITDTPRLGAAGVPLDLVAKRATEAYLLQASAQTNQYIVLRPMDDVLHM